MKKLVIILSIVITGSLHGQELKPFFSAIVVSNIDSSISWYKKILGLELRNRTDAPERGFIQANLYNKEMLIELIQIDSSLSRTAILERYTSRTRIRGYMKFGLVVKDIDVLYQKLKD